jgi:TolB-like protein
VPLVIASACGHLGRKSEAAAALKDLLAIDPEFGAHARDSMGPLLSDSGLIDTLIQGLQKAGLQTTDSVKNGRSTSRDIQNEPDVNTSSGSFTQPASGSASGEMWIAVLPFKNPGKDAELEALSDGLTEEVILGLSRFSYLRVIARHSTSIYKDKNLDIRAIGREIGARYLLEGTIRKLGSSLRFSVQLLDTTTGAHLWNETYKKEVNGVGLFELQDEIASRIASTVADTSGSLIRSMAAIIRAKPPEALSAYEAVIRGHAYWQVMTPEEHKEVRSCLQRAVELAPGYPDAWAGLARLYTEEYKHGFNPLPDPLGRALAAARRAIELDAANQQGLGALAEVSFFRKDFGTFRTAAERAIRLNPLNGDVVAFLGLLTAYSADWERGVQMAEHAMTLNPDHPGWYRFASFFHSFRSQNYDRALEIAEQINMPSLLYSHVALAAVYGQLGKLDAARNSLKEILTRVPDFASEVRDELGGRWLVRDPDLVEQVIEGLRKAGLKIPDAVETDLPAVTADPQQQAADSDAVRAQPNAMWIAVLPFQHPPADSEIETFADGLAQDITAALSQFSYLSVIAQDSTERLKARYVIQGVIRKSGS